ncbi:MAG: kinase/pyrophosphorylase [gamma proteobacterium endosymbiont of Lamellibrachia anaximandri]|nr:kinase/pyrophosphorylase [gamma proteobacterium endosymbiont of Lamellibrachia anaximandri]MBL3619268.1 kinase/pyrophosphorylase [gamma proteobacterium endosymbiont of Lamellibrachia anaximandri]
MSDKIKRKVIFLLSDSTGETAEIIINAALTQFSNDKVKFRRIGHVLSEDQVLDQLSRAEKEQAMVFYTFVNRDLAIFIDKECSKRGLGSLDLISPVLHKLTLFFGHSPRGKPGLLHEVGDEYFQRVEAMEFTLKNDDGQTLRHLHEADIILVGISRTSKTPLSIYLSCRGWKVVNIPLVKGIAVPPALLEVDSKKVVGLFLDAGRLVERREARVKSYGVDRSIDYINYDEIKQELRWARGLCRDHGWKVVHVAGKSVEETAHEVLVKLGKK